MAKHKYEKQVYLGFDTQGKQIRKRIYADSKAELDQKLHELKSDFMGVSAPIDITFIEYVNKWIDTYKSNLADKTLDMYIGNLRYTKRIDSMQIKNIKSADIQGIINENWKHAETCRKLKKHLKSVFEKAISDGLIKRNPVENVEVPKVIQKDKRALNQGEIDAIRILLRKENRRLADRDKVFMGCLFYFGLRPEEARALIKSDFNFRQEYVIIARALTYSKSKPILKGTKTENVRKMPIPSKAIPLLKDYCKTLEKNEQLFKSDVPLMPKSTYNRMWKYIKATIEDVIIEHRLGEIDTRIPLIPYTFRRNYATELYYAGITLKKAAQLMGHKNTKMLLEVYAQIKDEEENLDALKMIG